MFPPLLTDLITESSFPFPLTQASKQNKISTPEMGRQFDFLIYLSLICLGEGLIELLLHSTSLLFPVQFFTVSHHKDLQIIVKNTQIFVILILLYHSEIAGEKLAFHFQIVSCVQYDGFLTNDKVSVRLVCVSNFNMHINHLRILLKYKFRDLKRGQVFCISNKLRGNENATGPGPHTEQQGIRIPSLDSKHSPCSPTEASTVLRNTS